MSGSIQVPFPLKVEFNLTNITFPKQIKYKCKVWEYKETYNLKIKSIIAGW